MNDDAKMPLLDGLSVGRRVVGSADGVASTHGTRLSRHTSSGYERIRVVGREASWNSGSFGMAILYRRRDDDSLVILKEINLHELTSFERQLALNEVTLLSKLDHPNIISYYDSFEDDGCLMIEMEYAEGGNLAQLLTKQTDFLKESTVLEMFSEMISAVSYLHANNVLHRDLKSANIFLTKEHMIKIGDFGISKRMGTATRFQGAQTILGTPYYLSPEMCEGKNYNEKSDIWSLGCCLYEMVCLQKTFDGTSLPALVSKIVRGEYEQVKGPYSNDLKLLIRDMLKTDPEQRPTAARVLERVQGLSRSSQTNKNNNRLAPNIGTRKISSPRFDSVGQESYSSLTCHSALYVFDVANRTMAAVTSIPEKVKIKQLSISKTHRLLLTANSAVYSWGENQCGQLALGDRRSRPSPTKVEALEDKKIARLAAGSRFSVFCSSQGIVMTCGYAAFVGGGTAAEDWLKPKIVDALLREDVIDLACGEEHVLALCQSGDIYVWGRGEDGRMGTGCADSLLVPTKIEIPTKQLISNVRCGPDSSALITCSGTMMAMGSNRYNKLNLNNRVGFFASAKKVTEDKVANVLVPTCLKPFPSRVVDVSLGLRHTGVLLENGHVHLFGCNEDGELGLGNRQPMPICAAFKPVRALAHKTCVHLICGDGFTMAGTADNEVFFWGSKGKTSNATVAENTSKRDSAEEVFQHRQQKGKDGTRSSKSAKSAWQSLCNAEVLIYGQPTLVLRLDSTPMAGTTTPTAPLIRMDALICSEKLVMTVIDTAALPSTAKSLLPKREPQRKAVIANQSSNSINVELRRRSAPENLQACKTETVIPTWIRNELDNSENIPCGSLAEHRLVSEISQVKKRLHEQAMTFKEHEKQLNILHTKMNELQTLKRLHAAEHASEPPPAYDSQTKCSQKRGGILRNPFFSEMRTKVCTIL